MQCDVRQGATSVHANASDTIYIPEAAERKEPVTLPDNCMLIVNWYEVIPQAKSVVRMESVSTSDMTL